MVQLEWGSYLKNLFFKNFEILGQVSQRVLRGLARKRKMLQASNFGPFFFSWIKTVQLEWGRMVFFPFLETLVHQFFHQLPNEV